MALLAVLKAGAAYLPVDPGYPAERIGFMLADAAPVWSCSAACRALPAGLPAPVAVAGAGGGRPAAAARRRRAGGAAAAGRLGPGHPAYVIYTSGSTGVPKGVAVPHARDREPAGVDAGRSSGWGRGPGAAEDAGRVSTCRCGSCSGRCCTGARLVLARPGGHRDPGYLAGLIAAAAGHHGAFRAVDAGGVPGRRPAAAECAGLRRVICSGEALAGRPGGPVRARCWPRRLHNLYGPTEASVDVTAGRAPAAGRGDRADRRADLRIPGCTCWTGGCGRCRRG